MDGFLTPHFVHPDTKRFIWPLTPPTMATGTEKSIRARGKTVPWNQNTMLAGGYLNIAQAFELLGEEPATVAAYDGIVKAFTDAFFEKITEVHGHGAAGLQLELRLRTTSAPTTATTRTWGTGATTSGASTGRTCAARRAFARRT